MKIIFNFFIFLILFQLSFIISFSANTIERNGINNNEINDDGISSQPYVYTSFEGETYNLHLWEGEHIVLLTKLSNLDPLVMENLVNTFDKVFEFYLNATGKDPIPYFHFNGKTTIAQVDHTCGAGCAYLGYTGIELLDDYFNLLYNTLRDDNLYDQVVFYEFGRNFWFYGNKIEMGSSATAFAVFMRDMAYEALNISPANFRERPFDELINEVKGLLPKYMAEPSYNWENTIHEGKAPQNSFNLGGESMLASFLYYLQENYGGFDFINKLWKEGGNRPDAYDEYKAADNFIIASSIAANQNLVPLFQNWRWPVSQNAIDEITDVFGEDQLTTKIEVEDNYSIVSDAGANGAIKIKSFPINSNGKAVAIPDKGDKINVAFNIPSAGQYKLRVWLRSGNATLPTSYFNPDYSYQFDISGIGDVNFVGVPSSVQGPFSAWGGSHWGFMESTVNFSSGGSKTLGIMAKYVWQAVDYLEVIDENGSSVCEGDITLSTQAEVDAFNCTEVTGNLIISGNDITNLDGLASLSSIQGSLTISNNINLPNLDGFSSLKTIDGEWDFIYVIKGLSISGNDVLTNLDGLSSVNSDIQIDINNNQALTNIDGLSSITRTKNITIGNNDALTNIDGLSSVTSAWHLSIVNNNLLENISGLSSLTKIQGNVTISNNNSLPNLDGLSSLTGIPGFNYRYPDGSIGGALSISGNDVLTNIDGLSLLTGGISTLEIYHNNSLMTLDGLSSLTAVGRGGIRILDNPALTGCCGLFPLLNAGGVGGSIDISNNGSGCTAADILDGGPCDDQATTKIEIEDNYSIVSDVGSNGAIKIKSFSINSNGKGVAIPDKGDKINVAFSIPSNGQYKLRVWLRSGNATIPTSYFNPNYSYQFDISDIGIVNFVGVPSSVQGPFSEWGGSHWGFMEAKVNFSSTGAKTLGIMAKYVWQAVDYLEIIEENGCSVCDGDIILSTQAEVDAFKCTEVTGNLTISGSDITNLDGLAILREVIMDLDIYDNENLNNIDGLLSLKKVGNILISDNNYLTNLNGLASLIEVMSLNIYSNENLNNVDGLRSLNQLVSILIRDNNSLANIDGLSSVNSVMTIYIFNNRALTNIDGLSSITSPYEITISNNDVLTNIDGLSLLSSIDRMDISNNNSLINLDGLSSLTSVGDYVTITENPALIRCCGLFPLLDAGGVGGSIDISNNGSGCTAADILDGGPCDDQATTKIEIEDNYSIVSDVGSNGAIKIKSFSINSNGKGVAIPDKGDKINVAFSIPSNGQYKLRVWLRSGNATIPTSYFNPDYSYQFDISGIGDVNFVGVPSSVQGPFSAWGGSHWGFMEATVNFSSGGAKTLGIMAKYVWQAVDYLEIISIPGSSARIGGSPINTKMRLKDDDIIHIYPNPTHQKFNIELNNAIEGPAKLIMYDLYGRIVQQRNFSANELSKHQTIDVSQLTKGVYIVSLTTTEHANFMDKVVVE